MNFKELSISGAFLIEPKVFKDQRGYFFESFNQKKFEDGTGVKTTWVQDNQSKSSYGVLRGLHFQGEPMGQAKLVRVLQGKVLDVIVDTRPGSSTFGSYLSVELSASNRKQLFIPRGLAHGFIVLSKQVVFAYKCDNFYSPEHETGIHPLDYKLNIDWQVPTSQLVLSSKDKILQSFEDYKRSLNN